MREPSSRSPLSSLVLRPLRHAYRWARRQCSPRGIAMLAAAVMLISTSVVFLSMPAQAQTFLGYSLSEGQTMPSNSFIASVLVNYYLYMQPDGNLVQYTYPGNVPIWASGTTGNYVAYAVFQTDGNFVIYTTGGSPIWASHTYTFSGLTLQEQTDGNAVIYDSGTALWNTATASNLWGCWNANSCSQAQFSWVILGVSPQAPYPGGVNVWPLTIPNDHGTVEWTRREGSACFANYLGTSQGEPGSSQCPGAQAGIQQYSSWYWGFVAVSQSLSNGHYGGIISVFQNPVNSAYQQCVNLANAVAASPWGTPNFSSLC
jgi:hypothetical protein